jgi:UDP-3-O-[3-hydroxymyristoyl] N-acetylglucosamine deacetylase/3-hydroxyacyl-[acyl-carrier-protein] dehydratase
LAYYERINIVYNYGIVICVDDAVGADGNPPINVRGCLSTPDKQPRKSRGTARRSAQKMRHPAAARNADIRVAANRKKLNRNDLHKEGLHMPKGMDITEIMRLLPHRYPILLVDRILDYDEDTITGIKNVSINEPFFQGHFPGHPVMPGVLQVEGMAQCAGCLMLQKIPNVEDFVVYFMTINNIKFRKPVVPGDCLTYKIKILSFNGSRAKVQGEVFVEDKKVSEAELTAMIVPRGT